MSKSDKLKAADGCISLAQAASIAGLKPATLDYWVRSHFIVPSNAENTTPGGGNHRRFNLRDLTAICAASTLKAEGVSLPRLRRLQTALREYDKDLASARLALIRNEGETVLDVVLVDASEDARKELIVSIFDKPGQTIFAEIELAPVERRVRRGFAAAIKQPAIRGVRPSVKRTRGTKAANG